MSVDRFPVINITHKPKRKQADCVQENEDTLIEININDSAIPQNPTIETAIHFFETNAIKEYKNLYNRTAIWLRRILENGK